MTKKRTPAPNPLQMAVFISASYVRCTCPLYMPPSFFWVPNACDVRTVEITSSANDPAAAPDLRDRLLSSRQKLNSPSIDTNGNVQNILGQKDFHDHSANKDAW